MEAHAPVLAGKLAGSHLALGGGGLGSLIVHIIIWHEIWRLIRYVWRIPTVGPFLVILVIAALVAAGIWRRQRGPFLRRRQGSGSTGPGTGSDSGPRDW
jgi:hypothetical protein